MTNNKYFVILCIFLSVVATQNWSALEASLSGNLYLPGDTEYDEIRNSILTIPADLTNPQPLAIVQPISTADVQTTIQFANDEGIPDVTALAGGHGSDGFSFPLDGIQLDFSMMNSITVDAPAKTVTIEPGVIVGNITQALAPFNLGHTQGNCNSIGATGFLTYGGYGFWTRAEGLGIDTIVEYELVLANGTLLTVNANTNPDLFFACRGALPAYGIATKIKLNVFDTTNFYGGRLFYRFDDLAVSTQALKDWFTGVYALPDLIDDPDFNTRITFFNSVSFFPTFSRSITWTLEIIFLGPKTEAQKKAALLPLIDVDNVDFYPAYLDPTETQRLPMDYNTYNLYNFENQIQSFANLAGLLSHFRHGMVSDTRIREPNVMTDLLDKYMTEGFDFNSFTTAFQLGEISTAGGATSAVAPGDTAFYPREDFGFLWGYWTSYMDIPQLNAGIQYYDDISTDLTVISQSRGFYGNLNTVRLGAEFNGLGTNLPRLEKIKSQYDPNDLFSRSWDIATTPGANCLNYKNGAFVNPSKAYILLNDLINTGSNDKIVFQFHFDEDFDPGDLTVDSHFSFAVYDSEYNLVYSDVYEAWDPPLAVNAQNYGWKKTNIDGESGHKILLPYQQTPTKKIQYSRSGSVSKNFLDGIFDNGGLDDDPTQDRRLTVRLEFGNEGCIHVEFTDAQVTTWVRSSSKNLIIAQY